MPNHTELVDAFRRAMFVNHDADAVAALYAEDAMLTDPGLDTPLRGREAIAEYHRGFLQAFPDLTAEIRNSFGSGDWFAVELLVRGTHDGPLALGPDQTLEATGKPVTMKVCWIGRIGADAQFVEDHTYYDSRSLLELAEGVATAA